MNSLQAALVKAGLVDKKKVDEYNSRKKKIEIEQEKIRQEKEKQNGRNNRP